MTTKVLLIDGDKDLKKLVDIVLRPVGVTLHQAYSGLDGLKSAYTFQPDLVMLNVELPQMDGFEVCKRLREMASMPILMVTGRTCENEMLEGFRVGADDFVTKPFNKNELEVRVRALLKRSDHETGGPHFINSYNDSVLEIDLASETVKLCGEPVRLSAREYALLSYLIRLQGRLATSHELIQEAWKGFPMSSTPVVALCIFYLRKKLQDGEHGHQYIRNNRGKGYWFETRREENSEVTG